MARTQRATRTTTAHTLGSLKATARKLIATTRNVALARAAIARTRAMKAVSQWEAAFGKRVSQAAGKLGVPTAKEVRALSRQVAQLQASVERLRRSRARA